MEIVRRLSAVFPQLDERILKDMARPLAERLQEVYGRERGIPRFVANSSRPRAYIQNCLGMMEYVGHQDQNMQGNYHNS